MTDTDWITDRLPIEADADLYGEVVARLPSRLEQGNVWSSFVQWDEVPVDAPWRHTIIWRSPDGVKPTTTIPRKFTSITHAGDRYLALADDGTAWEDYGNGWAQLDPLPAREVSV